MNSKSHESDHAASPTRSAGAVSAWLLVALFGSALPATFERAMAATANAPNVSSQLGGYLAGRVARTQSANDLAAVFYGTALTRDPDNPVLLEQTFLMQAAEGNWSTSVDLAQRLVKAHSDHGMARLWLAVSAFDRGALDEAEEHFKAAAVSPIGEVTYALARGWLALARKQKQPPPTGSELDRHADWAKNLVGLHHALVADAMGRQQAARDLYEKLHATPQRSMRAIAAYVRHLAHHGERKKARSVLRAHLAKVTNPHPDIEALAIELKGREDLELLIEEAREGLAELLYGLGEELTAEGGFRVGTWYLQLALKLVPRHHLALTALAGVHEATRRFESANAIYDRIPADSSLTSAIRISQAINLDRLDKVDEAKKLLEAQAARSPKDIRSLDALGSIMRARKRYAEAIAYYSRLIGSIKKPETKHWVHFYHRGTCYERVKNWPMAESDLERARKLSPDQAVLLNYLGYSWVDQGLNLEKGLKLIERAVQLKPDDGYIVDSLGWAHFKLGNYKDAVRLLDRAVELRPEDPTLNDHLGDAFWQIGRRAEARYQWEQSLTLKPEPEDAIRIRHKLEHGLPPPTPYVAAVPKKRRAGRTNARAEARKRPAGQSAPTTPIQ